MINELYEYVQNKFIEHKVPLQAQIENDKILFQLNNEHVVGNKQLCSIRITNKTIEFESKSVIEFSNPNFNPDMIVLC